MSDTSGEGIRPPGGPDLAAGAPPTEGEIRDWLAAHLARMIKCKIEDVDIDSSFDRLGLDSAMAVGVTLDLEYWLGRPVEPAAFFDHPTVRLLAGHLANPGSAGGPEKGGGTP